jgi:eukaryotic-like serine/threonine-protein kinase
MTCRSCGAKLEPGARFCGVCGARVDDARRPAPQPQPKPAGSPARAPRGEPLIGRVLSDRFRVEAKLGEGGFGAVYRGVQTRTGRPVALKLLHPEMTRDKNLVARFRREGEVLCKLRDAHTVTTYDFDQTSDGLLYIAMELLEGPTLHDVFVRETRLAWPRMIKILAEICSSLAEAHALGIVHRDLKPENIHLEARPGNPEYVKVLDFGIAKVMRGEGTNNRTVQQLTATGQTLGTLEYMSPEQLMGKNLDGRSDIYAIGVLAYEMITGQLPFPDASGPAQLIAAQLKTTAKTPSRVAPAAGIPPQVDALIAKMLAKTPDGRFPDVSELKAACEALLAQAASTSGAAEPSSSEQPTIVAREAPRLSPEVAAPPAAPAQASAPAQAPAPPPTQPASAARRLWPWLLLAGILAAAAVASAFLLRG